MTGQYLIGRGLPSLRRAVTAQWNWKNSSHRRERPLAPSSTPIKQGLITGNCRSRCYAYAKNSEAGVAFPGACLGRSIWRTNFCSCSRSPLSPQLMGSRGKAKQVHLASGWRRCYRDVDGETTTRLMGQSAPDSSSRFTPQVSSLHG